MCKEPVVRGYTPKLLLWMAGGKGVYQGKNAIQLQIQTNLPNNLLNSYYKPAVSLARIWTELWPPNGDACVTALRPSPCLQIDAASRDSSAVALGLCHGSFSNADGNQMGRSPALESWTHDHHRAWFISITLALDFLLALQTNVNSNVQCKSCQLHSH